MAILQKLNDRSSATNTHQLTGRCCNKFRTDARLNAKAWNKCRPSVLGHPPSNEFCDTKHTYSVGFKSCPVNIEIMDAFVANLETSSAILPKQNNRASGNEDVSNDRTLLQQRACRRSGRHPAGTNANRRHPGAGLIMILQDTNETH